MVPTAAQAATIAAAVDMRNGRPIVVAVPLATEAERLAGDLAQFLPPDSVRLFPAWETLPFERVSPGVETMGARVEVLWRLRTGDPTLRVVVAPARALVQRLGPHVEDTRPIDIEPGSIVYSEDLVADLVSAGYRREYQVEHRGEVAVRGSIVDVFPATADQPVRIDLWGDEVDRLTNFSTSDQRATDALDAVRIFPARELRGTEEVRTRAEKLVSAEPWGAEQWQRIADGETFDGMEAWTAWLSDSEHVLYDLVAPDSLIVSVDPRRIRDRAGDIADEEASLGESLARTWGLAPTSALPRIHLSFERLLAHTEAHHLSVVSVADSPNSPAVEARSWPSAVGDAERGSGRCSQPHQRWVQGGGCGAGQGCGGAHEACPRRTWTQLRRRRSWFNHDEGPGWVDRRVEPGFGMCPGSGRPGTSGGGRPDRSSQDASPQADTYGAMPSSSSKT